MHRRMIKPGVLAFLTLIIASPAAFAAWSEVETGMWPKSWPKELEPLRQNARTIETATLIHENIYEIHFKDRDTFERSWPILVGLKSKNGLLTLFKVASSLPNQVAIISNEVPAVRIYASQAPGGISGGLPFGPPWPSSALLPDGNLPEYVKMGEVQGKKTWVPAKIEKEKIVWLMRARVDVELVIDGKIIDLNRIRIPSDTPIIDKRWPAEESKSEDTE
jgi:hypothetical protein